jgi:hypothetical protein
VDEFGVEKLTSWAKLAHFHPLAINFTVWSHILSTVGDALRSHPRRQGSSLHGEGRICNCGRLWKNRNAWNHAESVGSVHCVSHNALCRGRQTFPTIQQLWPSDLKDLGHLKPMTIIWLLKNTGHRVRAFCWCQKSHVPDPPYTTITRSMLKNGRGGTLERTLSLEELSPLVKRLTLK